MIEQLGKKQKIYFFLQQAIAFGGVFLLLAIIVLSFLKQTAYHEVDRNIEGIARNPDSFLKNTRFSKLIKEIEGIPLEDGGKLGEIVSKSDSVNLVFWKNDGNIDLSNIDSPFKDVLKKVKLKNLKKKEISQFSVEDVHGSKLYFRYKLVPVSVYGSPEIRYMLTFSNVNQIHNSTNHSMTIVSWSIFAFWLLSLGISLLLSHLFMRPILSSWHKQQEFVENASHELRTPLAVIQNQLELLFTKPDELIIDHSEEVSNALAEIRRLRQLTTDLLMLARSDIQMIEVDREMLDVAQLTRTLVKNYQLLGESDDKNVVFEVADDFPKELIMDAKLFQQLLVILLDNALKYTKEKDSIQVILERTSKEWSLAVKDTGIGIPNEKKKEIFERFTRVDSSRNRGTGGFGLGLSISKKIVEALGGKITVENFSPRGSVFRINLPM
ncbi:MAG: HAMP domain-containing histidine kinase [Lactobacillales bacterium]|jgi:two-component system sensor histidine kinase CiaH|nr:HAMP domain-containing histidine kinase [Lactobacillales bacterium]